MLELVAIDKRLWVPIDPICSALQIERTSQIRRLRFHAERYGLRIHVEAKVGQYGQVETEHCIPFSELTWWLRTLRPQSEVARDQLRHYLKDLNTDMAAILIRARGLSVTAAEKRLQLILGGNLVSSRTPPKRWSKITPEIAAAMKTMYDANPAMSYKKVGKQFGFSATLVCQVVNGTYPGMQMRDLANS